MAEMKPNAVKILNYLKETTAAGKDVTAADVAVACGIDDKKRVDGVFTSFVKKDWGKRIPAEIELEDGSHKAIKLLVLTEAGMAVDPTASADAE